MAIESSCDDSAICITEIETKKVIFHKRISQEIEHSKYGGVVPELAARMHADTLPEILKETENYFENIKAVAVTNAPGLTVSLMEGVMMAKAISLALNVPIVPVNHIKGHIYSVFIEKESVFPLSALVVSGGHTQVIEAKSYSNMKIVASSIDDSVGEGFDKVAKMLGFDYPGGPIIEKMAKNGDKNRFKFTVPLKNKKEIEFSYSGLKNSVRLAIDELGEKISKQDKKDIAASFQRVAFEHLFDKLRRYFDMIRPKIFAVVGGVSANEYFREHLVALCLKYDIEPIFAKLEYCSDNAVMIARAGLDAFFQERFVGFEELDVKSRVDLENE